MVVSACSVSRPAAEDTGQQIYVQLCANCHGANLEGVIGPPLGPGSNSASQPDEFLRFAITNGRGRMPSFRAVLDEGQVDALITYIREVQRN
ncbi:MAG: c-type cytochrome [Acidimicrobiia bacterium]